MLDQPISKYKKRIPWSEQVNLFAIKGGRPLTIVC